MTRSATAFSENTFVWMGVTADEKMSPRSSQRVSDGDLVLVLPGKFHPLQQSWTQVPGISAPQRSRPSLAGRRGGDIRPSGFARRLRQAGTLFFIMVTASTPFTPCFSGTTNGSSSSPGDFMPNNILAALPPRNKPNTWFLSSGIVFADAYVFQLDASSGLLSVTGRSVVFDLELCDLEYLINTSVPQKDTVQFGLLPGGTIDIDLEFLPGQSFENSAPLQRPPHYGKPEIVVSTDDAKQSNSELLSNLFSSEAQSAKWLSGSFVMEDVQKNSEGNFGGNSGPIVVTSQLVTNTKQEDIEKSWKPENTTKGRRFLLWLPTFLVPASVQRSLSKLFEVISEGQLAGWFSRSYLEMKSHDEPVLYWLAKRVLYLTGWNKVNRQGDPLVFDAWGESEEMPHRSVSWMAHSEAVRKSAPHLFSSTLMARRRRLSDSLRKLKAKRRNIQEAAAVVADDKKSALHNTYILVLTNNQWEHFRELEKREPSFVSRSHLVVTSHFPSFKRFPLSDARFKRRVTVPAVDRYTVLLLNGDGLDLRLKGTVTYMNPGQEHLSLEQIPLPKTVFFLMLLHLITGIVITVLLLTCWRERLSPIHVLLLSNFLVSALYLSLDWYNTLDFSANGVRNNLLWLMPRIFKKLQEIVALMVLLFVALGWKIIRPSLTRIEVQFASGICVVSFYLGIFEIILGGIQASRYILHILTYLGVLMAIHFNSTMLHLHVGEGGMSLTTGELYQKYRGYQNYKWIFILFIMKPMTLVFFKLTFLQPLYFQVLSFEEWIFVLADNLADYLIFLSIFIAFRPTLPMRIFRDLLRDDSAQEGRGVAGNHMN